LNSIFDTISSEIESCGLLIGVFRDAYVEVIGYRDATNILRSRYEFEIDPKDLIKTYAEAKEKGLEIIGIYHTHINHPPIPSKKDIEGMELWPVPWLIIRIPTREYTAWMLCGEKVIEMRIKLLD
jgi:proteasome lid subunit RPN8/RPN11